MTEGTARDRILAVADELFYYCGIQAVGIDEIVSRAAVAKTTLYWHFKSKDELVASYLRRRSDQWQAYVNDALAQHPGAAAAHIDLIFTLLAAGCADPGFRGCPFINAAAEFPDPTHPVRIVIAEHREWVRTLFAGLASTARAAEPDTLATWLVMLYDSAMTSTQLGPNHAAGTQALTAARILVVASCPTPMAAG